MNADVVTLDEVLAAADLKRASLVPETSGYLALAVGDATERLPFRVEERAVTLTTEGSVTVARGSEVVTEQESAKRLRDLLRRLLDASAGSMPGLDAAARPRDVDGGVAIVIGDIEAALIPVNRAAARRALARLARETLRAKQAGKLKRKRSRIVQDATAAAPASPSPPPSPSPASHAPEPQPASHAPEPTPPLPPATAIQSRDGEDVLSEASEPPPPMENAAPPADEEPPPSPDVAVAASEVDDEIVVDWTAAPPTPAPIDVVFEAPVETEADLSWSPPPATPAPVVALPVEVLPAIEPSPCPPVEPVVAEPVDATATQPPSDSSDVLTPIGEPEAFAAPEDLTVFDPSVVPAVTCEPPPAVADEPVVEALGDPTPAPAAVEAPAPIAVAAPEDAEPDELTVPRVARLEPDPAASAPRAKPRSRRAVAVAAQLEDAPKSSVEDLLSSFGAPADDRVIRAVAAGLKSLAGLEPTPPPPGTTIMRSPTPLPAVVAPKPIASPPPPRVAAPARSSARMALPLLLLVLAVLVTLAAYRPDLLALSSRF